MQIPYLARWVNRQDLDTLSSCPLYNPTGKVLQRLLGVGTSLKNFIGFLRTLSVLSYTLESDGAVVVTHAPTGSYVRYRADGNIDTVAARYNYQRGQAFLMNCPPEFDALSLSEMNAESRRLARKGGEQ